LIETSIATYTFEEGKNCVCGMNVSGIAGKSIYIFFPCVEDNIAIFILGDFLFERE